VDVFLAVLVVAIGALVVYIGVTGSQSRVWDLITHTGNPNALSTKTAPASGGARL
jgi:hypothetical protein